MNETSLHLLTVLANFALLGGAAGGIAVWAGLLRRLLAGRPMVEYSPRRPVPWTGIDLLAILFTYAAVASLMLLAADRFLGWTVARDPGPAPVVRAEAAARPAGAISTEEAEKIDPRRAHPIILLLSADPSPAILVLCMLSVVVMAPIGEEFLFRLLLQGYLEKVEWRARRLWRYPARLLGIAPILLTSLLFAGLHARDPQEAPLPVDQLIRLFTIDTFAKAIVVLGAILFLRKFRRATCEDLGVRRQFLAGDLRLALITLLAVFVPIIGLQMTLAAWFPDKVPDPLPLFPLALALGYLYFRTHRIVPSVLLHLAFNGASMALFFAWMASK
ncbi:MAG: CPBP family glutamic-type intramembrane protease [Thermoguttaceae bacterium]